MDGENEDLFSFLGVLPIHAAERIFKESGAVSAIFRSLSPLAQQYVYRAALVQKFTIEFVITYYFLLLVQLSYG